MAYRQAIDDRQICELGVTTHVKPEANLKDMLNSRMTLNIYIIWVNLTAGTGTRVVNPAGIQIGGLSVY